MKNDIGVGIIGLGRVGKKHLESLLHVKDAKVVAVCDIEKETVNKAAQNYKVKPYYDWRELIEDRQVEAVFILTPPDLHKDITIAAAVKGKHIFCEKPIASSIADAEEMAKAVEEAKVKFQLGFNERFDIAKVEAHNFIKKGGIGKPVMIKGLRNVPTEVPGPIGRWLWDDTKGGGPLVECILHEIDLCNWYFNSLPVRVYAEADNTSVPGIRCADNVALIIRYENGGIASLTSSWTLPSKAVFETELTVYGSDGVVHIKSPSPPWTGFTIMSDKGVGGQFPLSTKEFFDRETSDFDFTKESTLPVPVELLRNSLQIGSRYLQQVDFIKCIKEGVDTRVGAREGILALRIALAAVESYKKHQVVELS